MTQQYGADQHLSDVAITGSVTVDRISRDLRPHGRPADYRLLFLVLAKHLQPQYRNTVTLPMALRWTRIRTWDDLNRLSA